MSGWLLILALLVLGGLLSTLGDRLGSRVGKARLSLFNLRPRDTAVLITVLTGSLISAMSLGLMLLVSERLRVGLFQLDQLERKLRDSRSALERSQAEIQRAQLASLRAEQGLHQAQSQLASAERRAQKLRAELQPLQQQRLTLERQRDLLSRDIQTKDADIRRTEAELAKVNERIQQGAKELRRLETKLIDLRRGDVVISSGQPLATAKINLETPSQATTVIEALLQQANLLAYQRVLPGQAANRQILLVPRSEITRLQGVIVKPGSWVVSIISAANVLRGERQVLAFPDVRPNRQVIRRGEVMASTVLEGDQRSPDQVRSRLNLLMAATFTKAQGQGSLADGVQFDVSTFNRLGRELSERPPGQSVRVEAVSARDSDIADPIVVDLRWADGPGPPSPSTKP
ncbi:MAG: DUF3084 domain-containing protein [Synechococcaceae cyanobacterium ELA445]